MTDRQALLAAEMAKLGNSYKARLPLELGELLALAGQLSGSDADHPVLEELYQRLHKLAGSGGTFGFRSLSERSKQLELVIKSWMNGEVLAYQTLLGGFIEKIAALSLTLSELDTAVAYKQGVMAVMADVKSRNLLWLVDDDEPLGLELQRLLKQFGYEVRLFTRLDEVEAATGSEQPDILIMDVMFTEERVDATEEMNIRHHFKALHCPILFISARGDFAVRARAARLGASGFLAKPLDVPKLVDRIEQVMEAEKKAVYRVLIVDDDETLSTHYRLVLMSAGMEVEVLNQPEKIIERVSAFSPELVLMDMNMPEYTGQEAAMVIRQHEQWIGLPIIYISAEADVDKQIKAMGKGADDFLVKPISDTRLVAAVTVRAARARQLSDLMSKDSLTGLLKHSRIKEAVEFELVRAQRNGLSLCVVMIDIDHFKKVNDTYGHPEGDCVIMAVAHMLKQRLRKSDIVGRYGGEEFVAVLPECDAITAQRIMNDIRESFSALRFNHQSVDFGCTLSAGLVCNKQYPAASSGELLVAADEAMYMAKQGGRNRVCVA